MCRARRRRVLQEPHAASNHESDSARRCIDQPLKRAVLSWNVLVERRIMLINNLTSHFSLLLCRRTHAGDSSVHENGEIWFSTCRILL